MTYEIIDRTQRVKRLNKNLRNINEIILFPLDFYRNIYRHLSLSITGFGRIRQPYYISNKRFKSTNKLMNCPISIEIIYS